MDRIHGGCGETFNRREHEDKDEQEIGRMMTRYCLQYMLVPTRSTVRDALTYTYFVLGKLAQAIAHSAREKRLKYIRLRRIEKMRTF